MRLELLGISVAESKLKVAASLYIYGNSLVTVVSCLIETVSDSLHTNFKQPIAEHAL